jgi:hypothetical protein
MKITYLQAILELQKDNFVIGPENGPRREIIFKDSSIAPSEEEINAKIAELQAAEPMRLLRLERNRLLQETDWRFRSDLTPSQAWIDYCQALRDLPANSEPQLDENGELTNVTWPEKPE